MYAYPSEKVDEYKRDLLHNKRDLLHNKRDLFHNKRDLSHNKSQVHKGVCRKETYYVKECA